MGKYNYKIILFGNDSFHEIELKNEFEEGIVIGTTRFSKFRFPRDKFFCDFEISVKKENDTWTLTCSDDIYIDDSKTLKVYSRDIRHGDEIKIKYSSSDMFLFKLVFLIDFDNIRTNYKKKIDISGTKGLTIGSRLDNDIRLLNDFVGDDFISLEYMDGKLVLRGQNTQYGVFVNGYQDERTEITIEDYDFFMLDGYNFYYKDLSLYTDSEDETIQTDFLYEIINKHTNTFEYPKFTKSVRLRSVVPEKSIEVLPPDTKPAEVERNFFMSVVPTLVSFIAMMLMRNSMGGNKMFAVYCGLTMGIGVVTSIITYFSQGKKYRESIEKRTTEYTQYIVNKEKEIIETREKEKNILDNKYIGMQDVLKQVSEFDSKLFEKTPQDDDYLVIRLGSGTIPASCKIEENKKECIVTDDELSLYPDMLVKEYSDIKGAPVTVDLKAVGCLGIVGKQSNLFESLKNITIDIAARHFFDNVKLYYIFDEKDCEKFSWLRWFENVYMYDIPLRNMIYNHEGKKIFYEILYKELSKREGMKEEELVDECNHIIFVYDIGDFMTHPISKYINNCEKMKFTFIFFNEKQEYIPSVSKKIIKLSEENKGKLIDAYDINNVQEFAYDIVSDAVAEEIALKLGCVYVDSVELGNTLVKNISLYKLLDIISAKDLDLRQRWGQSEVYESMAAPLGVMASGSVLSLDINEKAHGPHGLVAGTTGSGKSEIIQSYILSMATLFHPYDVSFVIIDFKGGGMVNQFKDLPHLNGAITNIDDDEIDRSLLSIKAELKKRQKIFAEYNVNHIDAYIKLYKKGNAEKPLPHLIIVVDEFAELKSAQPDFMNELISAARIGRSLGVHLILATQKPAGVVNDQIWSNSKFKLCLKVQDKSDSNEVIKSPLAAEIKEPGRAYFQVGNNEIFELFQSAYSGCSAESEQVGSIKEYEIHELDLLGMRSMVYEQKISKNKESKTQLDAVVEHIRSYFDNCGYEMLPEICMKSLEEVIPYRYDAYNIESQFGCSVGIYDDPENQYQGVVYETISDGHMIIVGSAQYGKTNLLQLIIKNLAITYTPKELNIYILDFSSMILKTFDSLNHVGGVMAATDDDKVKKFFKMMMEELTFRKKKLEETGLSSVSSYREAGYEDLPQIVIVIDNFVPVNEIYLQDEDYILPILREGVSLGITVIVADIQTKSLGYKYFSMFSKKIALFCSDEDEYSSLMGTRKNHVKNIPGRGLVELDKKVYAFQSYLAFEGEKEIDRVKEIKKFIEEMNVQYEGLQAKRVPEIPKKLTWELAEREYGEILSKPYSLLLGVNYTTIQPDYINLADIGALGVITGEVNTKVDILDNIVKCLDRNKEQYPYRMIIIDDYKRKYIKYSEREEFGYSFDANEVLGLIDGYCQKGEELSKLMVDEAEAFDKEPLRLFVINNSEAISLIENQPSYVEKYKNIVNKYKNCKIAVVLLGIKDESLGYSETDIYRNLRDSKSMIIFNNIGEVKFVDMPYGIQRVFDKDISIDEGYYMRQSNISKYKYLVT